MSTIDVRNHGCVPSPGSTPGVDCRGGILNAIKAAKAATTLTMRPDLYFPGKPGEVYWVGDQIVWDALGKSTSVVMDPDVEIKFLPNRPTPTWRNKNGWLEGRHLFVIQNVDNAAFSQAVFNPNGAQQNALDLLGNATFVGDGLRVQNFNTVDAVDVTTYNMRGLTTSSTVDMPETFAIQWLKGNIVRETRVHQLALDGCPTATGIVSHYVKQTIAKDGVSYGVSGQAFGGYGNGTYDRESSWAGYSGNGYNHESGPNGAGAIRLGVAGDPTKACVSTHNKKAMVVNGNNNGRVASLDAYALKSVADGRMIAVTGTVPGYIDLHDSECSDPISSVINILGGTLNQTMLNVMRASGLRVHKGALVPLVAPKTLKVPAALKVVNF